MERYIRQIIYAGVGDAGQRKLLAARVLLVGCGALGTTIANNLVRAGIGHLTIVDRDFLELNNLQRQTLFDENDLRQNLPKAVAAAQKLCQINSEVEIVARVEDLDYANVQALVRTADLVMDGSDNFETRYLLNDTCVKYNKPWIYSGVIGVYGVTSTIVPGRTPCFRCLFPDQPPPGSTPTCDTAGILNSIVGTIGSIASGEAVKLLVGQGKLNAGLLSIDLWQNNFDRLSIETPLPGCATCDLHQYEFLDSEGDRASHAAILCGRNAVQISLGTTFQISLEDLAARLQNAGAKEILQNEYLLRFHVDSYDFTVFPDGRAIIKGMEEADLAKSLYARYIGL